jgi:Bacterial archaeo-eukaryotic release factor family 7
VDVVSRREFMALTQPVQGPAVSLFLPTHRSGPDTRSYARADTIRFKNLLREAERRLASEGRRAGAGRALLGPARRLLHEPTFWQYQSDGLAVFAAPGVFRTFRVPQPFEELVVVGERFHLKPLIPILAGGGLFYLLALSQNEVRLFGGTRDGMDEIELTGVPRSLPEALAYDDPEKQLQYHTRTPQGPGKRAAVFHGHEGDAKGDLLRYFQQVAAGLQAFLRDARAPLVVAGVDYLLPIYREANSYPYLLEAGIAGNPDELSPRDLHARAWPLVSPYFRRGEQEAVARYRELAGTGKTANDVRDVVPGAHQGRVDVLFVALNVQRWGVFDATSGTVELREDPGEAATDLYDLAAVHTIANGGTVYALAPPSMPDEAAVAAVFRY